MTPPGLDPDIAERAMAYARVFGDGPEVLVVLDDLVTFAGSLPDPQVRSGVVLGIHRILQMRALPRRQARKR